MPKIFKDKNNNVLYTGYETSEVVANPILAGTEDTLTGVQIGDTKYAVPQGGGSGLYKYVVNYFDSNNLAINKVTILSTTNYDLGEFDAVSSRIPDITQAEMKILFDFTDVVRSNTLFETLDTSIYSDNTHSIATDSHGYIITNESTSQNVVYIDIAYDETTDTYSFDTSYSQVIGSVAIFKTVL